MSLLLQEHNKSFKEGVKKNDIFQRHVVFPCFLAFQVLLQFSKMGPKKIYNQQDAQNWLEARHSLNIIKPKSVSIISDASGFHLVCTCKGCISLQL